MFYLGYCPSCLLCLLVRVQLDRHAASASSFYYCLRL